MNKHVFINCPYDESYSQLMRCLVFTVVSLGYVPRLAIESSDASMLRLNKIYDLINESRISIHDLSMIKSKEADQYFRLNMPFELGLDFGYKRYGKSESCKSKKYLILGSGDYGYMKALSDISGIDIKYHNDDIDMLIKSTVSWFVENEDLHDFLSPRDINNHFMDYNAEYFEYANGLGYDIDEVPLKFTKLKFY